MVNYYDKRQAIIKKLIATILQANSEGKHIDEKSFIQVMSYDENLALRTAREYFYIAKAKAERIQNESIQEGSGQGESFSSEASS